MEKDLVFFDGVCNLCSKSVQLIIKYDKHHHYNFASLQSNYAKQNISNTILSKTDSIILKHKEKFYFKSTAVLKIIARLKFPVNLFYFFIVIPSSIRDWVYDWIAAHRYKWFGKKEACWIPDAQLNSKFLG